MTTLYFRNHSMVINFHFLFGMAVYGSVNLIEPCYFLYISYIFPILNLIEPCYFLQCSIRML